MPVRHFSDGVPAGERCVEPSCGGAALDERCCFRHLDRSQHQAYLERLAKAAPEERTVDLRGVDLAPGLWDTIRPALAEMGTVASLLLSDASVTGKFELRDLIVLDE